jgi:hypothetical protein
VRSQGALDNSHLNKLKFHLFEELRIPLDLVQRSSFPAPLIGQENAPASDKKQRGLPSKAQNLLITQSDHPDILHLNKTIGFTVNSLSLNIPFMLLSTKVNLVGETEKRFATPFGTIDVTFRRVSNADARAPRFQLEVCGDTDNWIFCDSAMAEFKAALLHFIWGIAREDLAREREAALDDLCVCVRMKGAEVRLMMPCEYGNREQRKACHTGG